MKRPVITQKESTVGQITKTVIVAKAKFSLSMLFPNLHACREGISRKVLSRVWTVDIELTCSSLSCGVARISLLGVGF
jgi:hypothetical protein